MVANGQHPPAYMQVITHRSRLGGFSDKQFLTKKRLQKKSATAFLYYFLNPYGQTGSHRNNQWQQRPESPSAPNALRIHIQGLQNR